MTNLVDSVVNEVETGHKRGRRPGEKRPVYFYGVPAKTTGAVSVEVLELPGDSWKLEVAERTLKDKLGEDAQIFGPLYKVKGGVDKPTKVSVNPLTVKVDLREIALTEKQYTGVHENWSFFANGVKALERDGESFEDNDLVQIQFEKRVDDSLKSPKPRVGSRMLVRRSQLEEVTQV